MIRRAAALACSASVTAPSSCSSYTAGRAVTKLLSNLELIYAAKKIPRTAHCNNTIGTPGTLSSRNQPNHPTDSPEGIRAEIYEGVAYGSGDSVIGINPVDDSFGSVMRLLEMSYDIIHTWQIPTQNCVLAHVTTQMKCLQAGAPIGLIFQSIAGSQKGNESFGISVGMLDEAYALAKKHCFPAGPNYMYFETGQGSANCGSYQRQYMHYFRSNRKSIRS